MTEKGKKILEIGLWDIIEANIDNLICIFMFIHIMIVMSILFYYFEIQNTNLEYLSSPSAFLDKFGEMILLFICLFALIFLAYHKIRFRHTFTLYEKGITVQNTYWLRRREKTYFPFSDLLKLGITGQMPDEKDKQGGYFVKFVFKNERINFWSIYYPPLLNPKNWLDRVDIDSEKIVRSDYLLHRIYAYENSD